VIILVKFEEAEARLFRNKFVCRKCKTSFRTTHMKVLAGKVSCKKCGCKALRPVRKK